MLKKYCPRCERWYLAPSGISMLDGKTIICISCSTEEAIYDFCLLQGIPVSEEIVRKSDNLKDYLAGQSHDSADYSAEQ